MNLLFTIALCVWCAGSALLAVDVPSSVRPNMLFILADDVGYGDAGCYKPESKVATPNLDHRATEGM